MAKVKQQQFEKREEIIENAHLMYCQLRGNIKDVMTEKGIDEAKLSEMTGVKEHTIKRLLTGLYVITPVTIFKIIVALECKFELVTYVED